MAERRMFAKTIIDSDAFLEMPISARLLYYDLGMRADDDGFVNSPKKIMKIIGASNDDINILILRKFIIPFESGVVVIKHWKIHNYIRSDRYKPTPYTKEKSMLENKTSDGYNLKNNNGIPLGIPNGYQRDTQDRLGKVSIGKISVDEEERKEEKTPFLSTTSVEKKDRQLGQTSSTPTDINIFKYLETNFGRTISPVELEKILSYKDIFNLDIIKEAIDKACLNNAKTINYVTGILDSWKSKGFKKIEECRQEFFDKKSNSNKIPEWFGKKIEKKSVSENEKQAMQELLKEYKK